MAERLEEVLGLVLEGDEALAVGGDRHQEADVLLGRGRQNQVGPRRQPLRRAQGVREPGEAGQRVGLAPAREGGVAHLLERQAALALPAHLPDLEQVAGFGADQVADAPPLLGVDAHQRGEPLEDVRAGDPQVVVGVHVRVEREARSVAGGVATDLRCRVFAAPEAVERALHPVEGAGQ